MKAHAIIYREVSRIRYKRGDGTRAWICCPFHRGDSSPSCGINLDSSSSVPVGAFHCFGCGASGSWNKLAEKLGLEQISKDDLVADQISTRKKEYFEEVVSDQKLTIEELLREGGLGMVLPCEDDLTWREIEGRTLKRMGAKMGYSLRFKETMILLPVYVKRKLIGGVFCKWEKEKGRRSYLNSPGDWSKLKGLLPYDFARKCVELTARRTGRRFVVLVEGPRDMLRLLQEGIPAICILGTQSWSDSKRDLIVDLDLDYVVLAFDGDGPGVKATNQIRKTFQGVLDTRIVRMKHYSDRYGEDIDPGNAPDEVIDDIWELCLK